MNVLTVGQIVHFVINEGNCIGDHRAALIVKVLDKDMGKVNLKVFTDTSDGLSDFCAAAIYDAKQIVYSPDKALGTWHWID